MSVNEPPHRPTAGELDAARQMNLPNRDDYLAAMLELAHRALSEGQPDRSIDVLKSLAMVRPDDPRIYEALSASYQKLGKVEPARMCSEEALRLSSR
jgi:Flp pilus assembly protein TadD